MGLLYLKGFTGVESGQFDGDVLAFPEIEINPNSGQFMREIKPLIDMVLRAQVLKDLRISTHWMNGPFK